MCRKDIDVMAANMKLIVFAKILAETIGLW